MFRTMMCSLLLGSSVAAQPGEPFRLECEAEVTRIIATVDGQPFTEYETIQDVGDGRDRLWVPISMRNVEIGTRLEWHMRRPWEEGYLAPGSDSFVNDEPSNVADAYRYPRVWWTCEPTDYDGPGTMGAFEGCVDIAVRSDLESYWTPTNNGQIVSTYDGARFFCYESVPRWFGETETNAPAAQLHFTHVEVTVYDINASYSDDIQYPSFWSGDFAEPWSYFGTANDVSLIDSRRSCGAWDYRYIFITIYLRPSGGDIDEIQISARARFEEGSNGPGCSDDEPVFNERGTFEIFRSADMNADGIENGLDVGEFLSCYIQSLPEADLHLDGNINGLDISRFLVEFDEQAP